MHQTNAIENEEFNQLKANLKNDGFITNKRPSTADSQETAAIADEDFYEDPADEYVIPTTNKWADWFATRFGKGNRELKRGVFNVWAGKRMYPTNDENFLRLLLSEKLNANSPNKKAFGAWAGKRSDDINRERRKPWGGQAIDK